MKLSFERVLIVFLLLLIAGVVMLGIVNYNNNKAYSESSRMVDHTNEVLKMTSKTHSTIQDLTVRSFVTTGDSSLLEPYMNASRNVKLRIAALRDLASDNAEQQKRIDTLELYAAERSANAKKYLGMYDRHELTPQIIEDFTTISRLNMSHIRKLTEGIAHTEEELLKSRKEQTERDKSSFDFSIALVFGLIALLMAVFLVAVIYYIDIRSRTEKSIRQLNDDLERKVGELNLANKELESFSYSVSHDLRAPLRIIDGFAKIIAEEHSAVMDSEGKRFIETIRSNAQRMGMLIDDLLNFSRIGRQDLNLREINMNNLVAHVIETFKTLDKKLPADIQVDTLATCRCDEHLIQQVWVNLISNALKYSRKKDNAKVTIGCTQTATETVYYVKDNGVGFDMAFADKLFGVFQRLHKISEYEGTGVGLALVSRIVVRHEGRVWAEAVVDEGATFYFSIPR